MASEGKGEEPEILTPVAAASAQEEFFKEHEALRFAVAVDGSELAHKAFMACTTLMNKGDYIQVVHVADKSKTYLPYDLRPSSIREAYETNCLTRYPADRYRVVTISKEEGDSTRETIAHFVNHAGFDFLVVGMVGRKGPKLDPTILGSAADYSLRSAHCSSVIIKKPVSGPARFLVGVDGSERSHKTAEMIVNLAEAEDEVVIIHVNDDDAEDGLDTKYKGPAIKKRYQEFCASVEGVKCSYAEAEAPRAVTVAQVLSDYALDEDFTYLAIGADGMGAYVNGRAIFGSNSDRIVKICKVNVIVTQDRKEALG